MEGGRKMPEWVPSADAEGFASHVMKGVDGGHDGMPGPLKANSSKPPAKRRRLSHPQDTVRVRSRYRRLQKNGQASSRLVNGSPPDRR